MTAIVGLVADGRVLVGGDSAGVAGYQLTVRRDPKVFASGPYVYGFTSSFRMGQLIRYAFDPPEPPTDGDLHGFLATTWVDQLRETCVRVAGRRSSRSRSRAAPSSSAPVAACSRWRPTTRLVRQPSGMTRWAAATGSRSGRCTLLAIWTCSPKTVSWPRCALPNITVLGVAGPFTLAWEDR